MPITRWAEALGVSVARATNWIRTGLKLGTIERALYTKEELSGRVSRRTGFRLVTKEASEDK